MTKRPETSFNEADLIRWSEIAIDNTPHAPAIGDCLTSPQVSSYAMNAHPLGVTVRFKLDNGQFVMMTLNPLIAHQLVETLENAGEKGRWMNRNRHITFPIAED